jgi:hypothetical protein
MVYIKKRKVRSDKKFISRRKHGKMLPYYSKRKPNDDYKIWFWEEVPMSEDSIRRIPKGLRSTARKVIFAKRMRVDVPPVRLCNEKAIEQLAVEIIGEPGSYYLMMPCHAKNKFHCSYKKACSLRIIESDGQLVGRFGKNFRLFRYKQFWRGNKK